MRMLQAVPHRGVHREVEEPESGVALALLGEISGPACRASYGRRGRVSVVAVARLDDHDPAGAASVASIILEAYAAHGEDAPRALRGDFAFVLWDAASRRWLAARSPFGMRPLFFLSEAGAVYFASEVVQLLAVSRASRAVDERAVTHFLLGQAGDRNTFFCGIERVPAGHVVTGATDSLRVKRYFELGPGPTVPLTAREASAEFRARLYTAVERRLPEDEPSVLHLSGGVDSSSVVVVADAIVKANGGRTSAMLAAARFPGLLCDESTYIDAVARTVCFPLVAFDALAVPISMTPARAYPIDTSENPVFAGSHEIARRVGARTVLTGLGGDELLFEGGVFQDLAAQGLWRPLLSELSLARYMSRTRRELFLEALGARVPLSLRRILRRARSTSVPPWISPRLRAIARAEVDPTRETKAESSFTRLSTWRWLDDPRLSYVHELEELAASRLGIEIHAPMQDAQLVELVLGLTFNARRPRGLAKRLARDALASELPELVRTRGTVTTFAPLVCSRMQRGLASARRTLEHREWLSAPYVERRAARQLLETFARDPRSSANAAVAESLWDIVLLERWLRQLAGIRLE